MDDAGIGKREERERGEGEGEGRDGGTVAVVAGRGRGLTFTLFAGGGKIAVLIAYMENKQGLVLLHTREKARSKLIIYRVRKIRCYVPTLCSRPELSFPASCHTYVRRKTSKTTREKTRVVLVLL